MPCGLNESVQVGITLRNASKGAQPLPTLILKALDKQDGGGFGWTSYDTGMVVNPFRPEHVEVLSLTHSLAVTGKVLVAALEAFPSFSKGLQHLKVDVLGVWCGPIDVSLMDCAGGLSVELGVRGLSVGVGSYCWLSLVSLIEVYNAN